MVKWLELAHEKSGYLYPPILYWLGTQRAYCALGVTEYATATWHVDHEFSYLVVEGSFVRAGEIILERIKNDRRFISRIVEVNEQGIPIMLAAARKLSGAELSELSGHDLLRRFEDWLEKFLQLMTWSAMGTILEMEQPLLSNHLVQILREKITNDDSCIGEYFQILTSSTERTVVAQEEIDLIRLRIKQLSDELVDAHVRAHTDSYAWIAFGYDGPGWKPDDIRSRMEELPNTRNTLQVLLEEKEYAYERLRVRQESLEHELGLNDYEKYLFEVLRTLGFWKFERKFQNQQAHMMMEDFIQEICRRTGLELAQAKMIAPYEMRDVLVDGRADSRVLNERIKESVALVTPDGFDVYSGDSVKVLSVEIRDSLAVDTSVSELTGTTAYPGYAQGVVRIVDVPEEMEKINDGDILVSESTNPHILSAMKRAGAIVTNSGGITCHAAIVAREIQTPTVIGTKIATKALKDGDLVEVDATKGVVRKI